MKWNGKVTNFSPAAVKAAWFITEFEGTPVAPGEEVDAVPGGVYEVSGGTVNLPTTGLVGGEQVQVFITSVSAYTIDGGGTDVLGFPTYAGSNDKYTSLTFIYLVNQDEWYLL